jgi:hypothetical protein
MITVIALSIDGLNKNDGCTKELSRKYRTMHELTSLWESSRVNRLQNLVLNVYLNPNQNF